MSKPALYQKILTSGHVFIIWFVGGILFLYLSIPFFNPDSGMFLPDLFVPARQFIQQKKTEGPAAKNKAANEALLFVTINKKQFLTRFVTYISDEDLAAKEVTGNGEGKESKRLILVGRKQNKQQRKTKDDFFIQAAPKI